METFIKKLPQIIERALKFGVQLNSGLYFKTSNKKKRVNNFSIQAPSSVFLS